MTEEQPDLHLFDGYEERLAALPKPRWCKCGHIEGTHWLHEPDDKPHICYSWNRKKKRCKCTEFRPKKRKNRIKFYFTGRG
jgi:hypothetical protein